MSSYPPAGDYDRRLLYLAPKATGDGKEERYDVGLLASDNSETRINARHPAIVDGYTSFEASSRSVPWYRQKKWRAFMPIAAIIAVGAVVGGAIAGTVAHKSNTNASNASGPLTVAFSSVVGTSSGAGASPSSSQSPFESSTTNAGLLPTPPVRRFV